MLKRLATALRDLLLPAHCAACGTPAPPDVRLPLCETCGPALAATLAVPFCPACARHVDSPATDPALCPFCRNFPVKFDAAVRLGPFQGPLRQLILRCKYEQRMEIAPLLGRLLGERLALAPWAAEIDLVVPVPLHWSRRMRRGYNQAALVAEDMAAAAFADDPPPVRRALRRTRPTPHQASLPAKQRRQSVRGAFATRWGSGIKGKRILLVDDVMTSGSTIGECTHVLLKAGAAAVFAAVLATADYDEAGVW